VLTYGWVAFSAEPIGDLGIAFLLDPGEAYIYDCATRPEHRGHGYYAALLRFMAYDLGRDGLGRAWIGTAPGNVVSQRGIARAGFAKVADVRIDRQPGGAMSIQLLGVPGADRALLDHAAWCFHGRAVPDRGQGVGDRGQE
jgi:RimJ/RimL family protein N-acetyltransferase